MVRAFSRISAGFTLLRGRSHHSTASFDATSLRWERSPTASRTQHYIHYFVTETLN